jgi:ABC-type transporter Mla MlaB component
VVFSFFKGKGSKPDAGVESPRAPAGARPAAKSRPLNGPVNRSLNRSSMRNTTGGGFAVTDNALSDRESARSRALATAAKIDAIESEMARDFLRPRKVNGAAEAASGPETSQIIQVEAAAAPPSIQPVPEAPAKPERTAQNAPPAEVPAAPVREEDIFDPGSDILVGSISAIEVGHGGNLAILDETAILFANGRDADAESGLRAALVAETLGSGAERGWLMLLELIQQRADRPAFDQLAAHYAGRFGLPAPSWIDYQAPEPVPVIEQPSMPTVVLPQTIDASIVRPLEEFKALAVSHPALGLDASNTESIDLIGAELLLRVFYAFRRASHTLHLTGAEPLLQALKKLANPGDRAPSDAAWMLMLELLRALDRQDDFEEAGIQYCITFEVSPPSWEPPLPNIRLDGGDAASSDASAELSGPLVWRGDITSDADRYLRALSDAGRSQGQLVVDCERLRRIAFSAGSAILGQLFRLQQSGVRVEFRHVNCLVAGLFQLLGVASLADVRIRRA